MCSRKYQLTQQTFYITSLNLYELSFSLYFLGYYIYWPDFALNDVVCYISQIQSLHYIATIYRRQIFCILYFFDVEPTINQLLLFMFLFGQLLSCNPEMHVSLYMLYMFVCGSSPWLCATSPDLDHSPKTILTFR